MTAPSSSPSPGNSTTKPSSTRASPTRSASSAPSQRKTDEPALTPTAPPGPAQHNSTTKTARDQPA